ncbi:DnaK family protein [Oesophagostomum dentatum]|uniref:Hypoxia up-regulated protein 1 n=1 Tax=Oesophagostomum dentatum TaxID=61180 RepID=A0A0B1TRV3_OESDE|nr:DnaK family protein [Oesophagostomum dentatum]
MFPYTWTSVMILRSSVHRFLLGLAACACLFVYTDGALAAMSIDLGSEFIKIGLVKPGVPMEIVLNKESRRKTPNVLVIRNNERLFAEAAAAVATKYPNSAYHSILTLLAKQKGDPSVDLYKKRFPFVAFTYDETRNTVAFPSDNVTYNVETLLAMILWSARQTTEAFALQRVKDCVITVPIFFNQAERRALVTAADIAGLNLLQLLNDGTAAALNYGVFRRKEITEKPQYMMIYDMGSSKTVATIVEYVLEPDKSSKVSKTSNPVVKTVGVGYDRTLGGYEITLRMRDHLAKVFRDTVKTSTDITTNARSMAKLLKEAERVKQVLSANKYHFAQIEAVHEEQNFRAKVTREELEEMIVDLEPRFVQPINDALAMAGKTIEQVDQFVLMGAGTRVPKIQEVLKGVLKDKEKLKPLKAPVKPTVKTIKIRLNTTVSFKDFADLDEEQVKVAKKILADFDHAEREKHKREEAMNSLEGLVYDLAVKIQDGEEFAEYVTKEEKEKIAEEVKRLRTWMEDETDINTPTEEFISNKAILDNLTASANNRKSERLMFPKMVETMKNIFNESQTFYKFALNMTTSDDPVFTETEIEVLAKLINTTTEWWEEKRTAYEQQPKYEDPVMTAEEVAMKIRDLDREVKYLLNKLKNFKPKKKPEKKEAEKNATEESSTSSEKAENTTDSGGEEKDKSVNLVFGDIDDALR